MESESNAKEYKKVYIIGAGFTKAWNPELAPVMADFFKIASQQDLYKRMENPELFKNFVSNRFGSLDNANLESVATSLRVEAIPYLPSVRTSRETLYHSLLLLINAVLGNIHKSPIDEASRGLYLAFFNKVVQEKASIITFNYDLLIDHLLETTGKWFVRTGYGIWFDYVDQEIYELPNRNTQEKLIKYLHGHHMVLLKLHGSLNWCVPMIPDPNAPYKVVCSAHSIDAVQDFSYGRSQFTSGAFSYYTPFIIPPLIDKSQIDHSDLIKNIWYCAFAKLFECEEVDIIGYSFPPSDFATESLIRESLFSSVKGRVIPERKIRCINKSITEDYKARVSDLFYRYKVDFIEMDFIDYLDNSQ